MWQYIYKLKTIYFIKRDAIYDITWIFIIKKITVMEMFCYLKKNWETCSMIHILMYSEV